MAPSAGPSTHHLPTPQHQTHFTDEETEARAGCDLSKVTHWTFPPARGSGALMSGVDMEGSSSPRSIGPSQAPRGQCSVTFCKEPCDFPCPLQPEQFP